MIIGIDPIFTQPAAHQERSAIGNDFIHIHIMTGASARLKGINQKLVIPLTIYNFLRS